MASLGGRAIRELPLARLRQERAAARRALELARMRSRPDDGVASVQVENLRARVTELTEELIRRYADDLTLVDSLLHAPYAQVSASAAKDSKRVGRADGR